MRLLSAARIVRTLGLTHAIEFHLGRTHVGTPNDEVAEQFAVRVKASFQHKGKGAPGPDAVRLGVDACVEAVTTYALAVHARNGRGYRRVMRGSHAR